MRLHISCRVVSLSLLISSFLGASASAQTRYGIFSQLAVGGGWSCDIYANNQRSLMATGLKLAFFDDDGNPLNVNTPSGTLNEMNFSLAAGETTVIPITRTGAAQAGYAVLSGPANASIRATLILRFRQGNQVSTGVGVPIQSPFEHYSFAAEVGSSVNTGLALANAALPGLSTSAKTFVVALIREDGTLRDWATLRLNSGDHASLFLDDPRLFPGLTDFRGTVSVSGPSAFGLIALRLEQSVLSSVSVNYGPVLAPFAVAMAPVPEVEPNNSSNSGQMLTLPAVIDGVVGVADDRDYFRFSGEGGDILAVMVEADVNGSQLDSMLSLMAPNGSTVAVNDQNGLIRSNDSFMLVELPSTGTYSLLMEDFFGDGGAEYGYRIHLLRLGDNGPPPVTGDLDGAWTGMTGQGFPLSFTIDNNSVTQIRFAGRIQGPGCMTDFDQTIQGSIPIVNNPFDFSIPAGPGGVSVHITGSFTSDSTANGNVTMTLQPIPGVPSCSGTVQTTWSATKGGGGGPGSIDGTWSGTTGQNLAISFTVSENQITRVDFSGRIQGVGCSSEVQQSTQTSQPISGNSFDFSVSAGPGGVAFRFSGSFSTSTMSAGDLRMTLNPIPGVPGCAGTTQTTWSANKQ